MSHIRQQVRDAATVLLTGLGTTGANAWAARDLGARPLQEAELPGLVVEVLDERVVQQGYGGAGGPLVCEAELRVTVLAKATTGYADTADTACAEAQTAIANAGRIAGAVVSRYEGTDGPFIDASTDRPVARAVMHFALQYVMAANAPTTPL